MAAVEPFGLPFLVLLMFLGVVDRVVGPVVLFALRWLGGVG